MLAASETAGAAVATGAALEASAEVAAVSAEAVAEAALAVVSEATEAVSAVAENDVGCFCNSIQHHESCVVTGQLIVRADVPQSNN